MSRFLPPLLAWLLVFWVMILIVLGAELTGDPMVQSSFERAKTQAVCVEAKHFDPAITDCGGPP